MAAASTRQLHEAPYLEANASILAIEDYQKIQISPNKQTNKMKTETRRPFPTHDHDLVLPKAFPGHSVSSSYRHQVQAAGPDSVPGSTFGVCKACQPIDLNAASASLVQIKRGPNLKRGL